MFKHAKKLLVVAAMLMAPLAGANVISTNGYLNSGDIDYYAFDVTNAGAFNLSLTSNDFDTELFLFARPVSDATLIAYNDDIGWTGWFNYDYNSLISTVLGTGSYIAAIGAYNTTGSEAVTGSNPGNGYHGNYNLTISSTNGTATSARAVSEPGTIGLLGAGLVALALVRRRKAA